MDGVGSTEPGWFEVFGSQLVGGAAVGDEGPLATRRDEHADPSGRSGSDPHDVRGHPVRSDGVHERPSDGIATDGRNKGGSGAEPAEPARRVRSRAALTEGDSSGDVGPAGEGPCGHERDIEDEVANDDDARRPRRSSRATRPARSADVRERGHLVRG